MIPEGLFQLSARDLAGAFAIPNFRRINTNGVIAFLAADLVVPTDQVMLLELVRYTAQAFAGNTVLDSNIDVIGLSLGGFARMQEQSNAVLVARSSFIPGHPIWIPPGSTVRVAASYSNGAVNNSLSADFVGYLIPRGNIGFL